MSDGAYRPSNGSAGMDFESAFCWTCEHYDHEAGCPILNDAHRYDLGDADYPNQWRSEDGTPRCISHVEKGMLKTDPEPPVPELTPMAGLRDWAERHGVRVKS